MASARNVDEPSDEASQAELTPLAAPAAGGVGGANILDTATLEAAQHLPSQPKADPRSAPLVAPTIAPQTDPALGTVGHRGYRSLFRNRLFLRLWIAQLISQTIMNATNYGMIILVSKESNSTFATSGAFVAFSLPAAIFGAPAGVLVDRFDRRLVLWVSNALRAVVALVFVLSLVVNPAALWPVYTLTFILAVIGQFFGPAEGAAIPKLVHKNELMNALALFNITFTLAQVAGLILLGPLALLLIPTITLVHITILPAASLFVLIALLYLVCAGLILSIPHTQLDVPGIVVAARSQQADPSARRRRYQTDRRLGGIWKGIVEVMKFIWHDGILQISVWQLTLAGLILSIVALFAPRFVEVFFHAPPELAALVFLPAGIGVLLGSAVTPYIARRLRYTVTITIGIIAISVCAAMLTIARWLAPILQPHSWWNSWPYLTLIIGLTFAIGVALDFVNVPAQTRMQEHTPDAIKGRVLSTQTMLLNLLTAPILPLMGVAADTLGLGGALLILAGAVASLGLLSVYLSGRISRKRREQLALQGRTSLSSRPNSLPIHAQPPTPSNSSSQPQLTTPSQGKPPRE